MIDPSIFRPYNVRGIYPSQLDEDGAYLFAQAFAKVTKSKKVAVGRDARLSGPSLQKAVTDGLQDIGVDVTDLGIVTTDEIYFASGAKGFNGIQVSASHNPPEWNGLKFIKSGSVPLADEELAALYAEAKKEKKEKSGDRDHLATLDLLPDYSEFLLGFIDASKIKSFRLVVNPLNGTAGPVVSALAQKLPMDIIALNMEPDGHFPKGNPDPFLPEMRRETSEIVRQEKADFGVAWDNDADRVAFFDENGEFVPGAFTTGLLAQHFLKEKPGSKIISEPRVVWPVKETVEAAGGVYLINKPGHVFLKDRMRKEDALFGGELSGHYFFRDFWYSDNGFIPFLLLLELLSTSGKRLSELVQPFRGKYFFSEEINFDMDRAAAEKRLDTVEAHYKEGHPDRISGLSVAFPDWRFNLRPSDNEPKLRLTVEARQKELVQQKVDELTNLIKQP